MLLVIRTQTAIIRAAEFGAALKAERLVARLDVVLAQPPIGRIGRDQRRLHTMLSAAFLVPDLIPMDRDLGGHQREAFLAQGLRLPPKDVGPAASQRRVHARCLVTSGP